MHVNALRNRRRKEMDNYDTYIQSTIRYNLECGECKAINLSDKEKNEMINKARKARKSAYEKIYHL